MTRRRSESSVAAAVALDGLVGGVTVLSEECPGRLDGGSVGRAWGAWRWGEGVERDGRKGGEVREELEEIGEDVVEFAKSSGSVEGGRFS